MSFSSRNEAIEFIILNQFGRRNLQTAERALLALKLEPIYAEKAKERQKTSTGGISPQLVQNSAQAGESLQTRKELAKIANVSHDTMGRVKAITKEGTPEQLRASNKVEKATALMLYTRCEHENRFN